ncbi:hypothetical protein H6P81_018139 [Aristolochia fimbriata]|uniref:Aminotransferase-like plant mobile domain-containing protein n=1 Tax=Aristolochia fimbriata TaxID=158543 RepID=A0AAV7E285_ARIFI|nr:hypothetical protein H6P81_018139 [Aristolochia fimbriata]
MLYNVLGWNPRMDHISIWMSFTCNVVVDETTIEFKESSEDPNDISSGEDAWPDPVIEEVEEEEEVEFSLPTMGVLPLEENDEPYPDSWIGEMNMEAVYTNTMVPGLDEDNIPPSVEVGVGKRFMSKDALQMYLKDYCIKRYVQFKVNYGRTWRARNKAVVAVFGGWEESYNLLPQFFKAIKDTNRGTKYKMITTDHNVTSGDFVRFDRVVMVDTPLLYDQDSHRSEAIWHGEDPGCLDTTLADGRAYVAVGCLASVLGQQLPYIEGAGFGALYSVQWLRLDKPLITSLVERWRSETNTFHLANGEMAITLEDVAVLLGLRVDGFTVTGSTWRDWMELARVLLGVELPPGSFQGGRLSLAWIRGRFSFCPVDVPDEVLQQHARAYLLHLVGSTIFLDGSAQGVHMAYLTLFEDFNTVERYNWRELRLPSSTGSS